MGELELLERNVKQAKQNFNYADPKHRNKAIYDLIIADEELKRYVARRAYKEGLEWKNE